jgi:hypothetical protein
LKIKIKDTKKIIRSRKFEFSGAGQICKTFEGLRISAFFIK